MFGDLLILSLGVGMGGQGGERVRLGYLMERGVQLGGGCLAGQTGTQQFQDRFCRHHQMMGDPKYATAGMLAVEKEIDFHGGGPEQFQRETVGGRLEIRRRVPATEQARASQSGSQRVDQAQGVLECCLHGGLASLTLQVGQSSAQRVQPGGQRVVIVSGELMFAGLTETFSLKRLNLFAHD